MAGAPEPRLGRPERDTSYVPNTGRRPRRPASPPPRLGTGPRTAASTGCRRPRLVPSHSKPGRESGWAPACALCPAADCVRLPCGRVSSTGPAGTHSATLCATSSGATSTGPLAAAIDRPRRAPCTGQLPLRSAACTTERTAGASVCLPPPGPEGLPRFAYPPSAEGRLYHSLPFSLAVPASSVSLPSPYFNSSRVPCLMYIGRKGWGKPKSPAPKLSTRLPSRSNFRIGSRSVPAH